MSALLDVQGVASGYGDVPVLSDISLTIGEEEIVSVVGANGAGKTTLLSTISGLIPANAGTIRFNGEQIERMPAHQVVPRRLIMVPEGGRLFPFMTVLENIQLGAFNATARPHLEASLEAVLTHFPILAERRDQLAGSLSGGERQMCAIARAMMSKPKLLMLDEPSLGLSPQMVERVFDLILALVRQQRIAILLVEQNVGDALDMAHRAYVMERGRIVKTGTGKALLADADVQRAYLGI